MDQIVILGLNHHTAPVGIRECLAFSPPDLQGGLMRLFALPAVSEVMLLSTCNRVEVLMAARGQQEAVGAAKSFLADAKQIPLSRFEPHLYVHAKNDAVRHVFRVAASLDSMMVGEPQILGQMKSAYVIAAKNRTSGVLLNRLLHRTFSVAKKIRTETGIGDHAVSISYAAIELARKIFGSLKDKTALLIGAGEMAELAMEHLLRHKVSGVLVANRTFERAVDLAGRLSGKAIRMEEVPDAVSLCDIVVSSTGALGYVLEKDQVKSVMRKRKNRPIFFIDIAVPRDIDPAINKISNVYVYDIDDLKIVVDENIKDREKEAVKAERIVEEAVIRFGQWYRSMEVVPTIKALRFKAGKIAETECEKTLGALSHLSEKEREAVRRMSESIVNKILHDPTLCLKNNGYHKTHPLVIDMARKLFNLDEE